MLYAIAIFLPLITSIIAAIFSFMKHGKEKEQASQYDKAAQLVTAGGLVISAIIAVIMFFDIALTGKSITVNVLSWIQSGQINVNWALRFDTLSVVMICVVTIVSSVVHIYSFGYMHEDASIARFQSYLSLFTFGMLMLVTADNLAQLFFGWEAVGLCSYLLIGFWYHKPSANSAAMKAFIVNRVGDFGFSLGIFATFMLFRTINFDDIFALAPQFADAKFNVFGFNLHALTVICLLLFVGAMGKSAQLGLHVWLPDAMEGPTPVSALIHAATMVTAGVFMVARLNPLFDLSTTALIVVTLVGAFTAFFAATIGCVQNDIKRVIAFSTCSQLGYMFFALGVQAYQAGIFHLTTHAFFKALLFLGAGAVIHAMHHEQDMRNMGGLWKKIPITYGLMMVGTLAIIGFPFLSGFFSKDMILEAAFMAGSVDGHPNLVGKLAYGFGTFVALLTAFYSWRLVFMTFHGKPKDQHAYDHAHDAPWIMLAPMMVLVIGSIFAGGMLYKYFVGGEEAFSIFWGSAIISSGHTPSVEVIHAAHEIPIFYKYLPTALVAVGTLLAFILYMVKTDIPASLAQRFPGLYNFLLNKWYFDELYEKIFINPCKRLGTIFWKRGDIGIIDRFGPDGVAQTIVQSSKQTSKLQTGFLNQYALVMLVGVILLLAFVMIMGGK
ncbi:MAG: NADH-quinone oxidoreductase subunit L [Alphaproteobacteria bacterium]